MIVTELRQTAPELDGQPSFSESTEGALRLHAIGPENAGRILALENVLLKVRVREQLYEICEEPREVPDTSEIFPILRNSYDFVDETDVALQVPATHAKWSELPVDYIVYPEVNEESEVMTNGLIALLGGASFTYQVAPDWPGLLRTGFYRALEDRKNVAKSPNTRLITSFGRIFFESCFYSDKFDQDIEYRNSAYRSLRNFKFKTPIRPKE